MLPTGREIRNGRSMVYRAIRSKVITKLGYGGWCNARHVCRLWYRHHFKQRDFVILLPQASFVAVSILYKPDQTFGQCTMQRAEARAAVTRSQLQDLMRQRRRPTIEPPGQEPPDTESDEREYVDLTQRTVEVRATPRPASKLCVGKRNGGLCQPPGLQNSRQEGKTEETALTRTVAAHLQVTDCSGL